MATEQTINDLIFTKLAAFNGDTLNDRLVSWLSSQGATGGDVNTLWHSLWDSQLINGEQFNERQYAWLLSEGAGQDGDHVNTLLHNYWSNFT